MCKLPSCGNQVPVTNIDTSEDESEDGVEQEEDEVEQEEDEVEQEEEENHYTIIICYNDLIALFHNNK